MEDGGKKVVKKGKLWTALGIMVVITVVLIWSAINKQSSDQNALQAVSTVADGEMLQEGSYAWYQSQHEDVKAASETVVISGKDYSSGSADTKIVTEESSGSEVLYTAEEGYADWTFTVPETAMYQINIEYFGYEGKGSNIERNLYLDGEIPYREAKFLQFNRRWSDEYGEIKKDMEGNDIRPQQTEVKRWISKDLMDSMGYSTEPLTFYLEKGTHTLRLEAVKEPMLIQNITLYHMQPLKTYAQVKEEYKNEGYKAAAGTVVYKQAEEMFEKTEQSNYPINDHASPDTVPQEADKLLLNTMGGTKWQNVGSSVTWKVSVSETGLYKLAPRYKQDLNSGETVTRELRINGEIPFEEAKDLRFDYSSDWQCKALGTGTEDFVFYLEAGKEYEISLTVCLGDMAGIMRRAQSLVGDLNDCYCEILMITGAKPDKYRDYEFDKLIPDVFTKLQKDLDVLNGLINEVNSLTEKKGEKVVVLENLSYVIEGILKDQDTIPEKFSYFKDCVAAMGTWILNSSKQPLQLDYFALIPSDEKVMAANSGFLKQLGFGLQTFRASFTMDFNNVGITEEGKVNQDDRITVWLTSGRDQQSIIRNLIDNYFTPETGIAVELKLVAGGTLLPSVLAGNGPDVSLSNSMGDPVNYAVRNAVKDISGFEGFDEVLKRFNQSAIVPYQYNGATYALPETESFDVLFYRTDIFDELGLKVPETWDDWDVMIQELQKKNMSIGLPHSLNTLLMFMYQNGAEAYNNAGETTNLDSAEAAAAFSKLVEYYSLYGFPTEYDFVNRFRSGEMPIAIADYTVYNQLSLFAPEIKGEWKMAPIPGTLKETGEVVHTVPSTGTSVMMLKDAKQPEAAWEFMKWWTSAEIQALFGNEMENVMDASAKQATANMEALSQLDWPVEDLKNLLSQWEHVKGTPEVPGGYFTARIVGFAFNASYNDKKDPEDTLLTYISSLNAELTRKRLEFGID